MSRVEKIHDMIERLYGDKTEAQKGCLVVGASVREALIKRHLQALYNGLCTLGHLDAARELHSFTECELSGCVVEMPPDPGVVGASCEPTKVSR